MATYDVRCTALSIALTANVPVILWGGPGIGKTSVIEQIARHNGWWLETVIASISDPTDFKGMPRDTDGRTTFSPPAWAGAIADANGGLVFLDEISTAPPSVQAALLRPVFGRVVGDLPLPAGTRFVAAANPPEIAADGWDLSGPLANRFLHLEWAVPAAVISEGFVFGFEPIRIPALDDTRLAAHTTASLQAIGAFLRARPDLAHRMPTSGDQQGQAWPSPRSWQMGAIVLAHALAANAGPEVCTLLLGGCVGGPTAREFLTWQRMLDLPDIEEALGSGILALPDTPDRVAVVCGALATAVNGKPSRARCETAVNTLLVQVCEAGHTDLAAMTLRRIRPAVHASNAILSPQALALFADLLARMGRLAVAR